MIDPEMLVQRGVEDHVRLVPQVRDRGMQARGNSDQIECFADPLRLRLLNLISAAGKAPTAHDLVEQLGVSQRTVTDHLDVLRDLGLSESGKRRGWGCCCTVPGRVSISSRAIGTHHPGQFLAVPAARRGGPIHPPAPIWAGRSVPGRGRARRASRDCGPDDVRLPLARRGLV